MVPEILAPYLKNKGQYVTATYDADSDSEYRRNSYKAEMKRLKDNKKVYGEPLWSAFQVTCTVKKNLRMVLSFRNYHNWIGKSEFENCGNLQQFETRWCVWYQITGAHDRRYEGVYLRALFDSRRGSNRISLCRRVSDQRQSKRYQRLPRGYESTPTLSERGLDKKSIKKMQKNTSKSRRVIVIR